MTLNPGSEQKQNCLTLIYDRTYDTE